ncbi:hypothetical protein BAE44_0012364, partial [Dichanthelium oligosanthes]
MGRHIVLRDRNLGDEQLYADYFSPNPVYGPRMFWRRFRMHRSLFNRITDTLSLQYPYFQQRRDAVGKLGCSPRQKVTAAMRMLA